MGEEFNVNADFLSFKFRFWVKHHGEMGPEMAVWHVGIESVIFGNVLISWGALSFNLNWFLLPTASSDDCI